MKEKHSFNFGIGLLLGVLVVLIVWYWQKSTRAEDGALDLLDRLKQAEDRMEAARARGAGMVQRVREMAPVLSTEPEPTADADDTETPDAAVSETAVSDDLQQVKGIGPVFAERLHAAGIHTFGALAALGADALADALDISAARAGRILTEVQRLV